MTTTRILLCSVLICSACSFSREFCPTKGCDKQDRSRCQYCEIGCFGRKCRRFCSFDCNPRLGCEKTHGRCLSCRNGRFGEECEKDCLDPRCQMCDRYTGQCAEVIRNQNHCEWNVVVPQTQRCPLGCQKGWKGEKCDVKCTNCLKDECGHDGYCLHGCKPGFYGDACEGTCGNCLWSGCDRFSGNCDQCLPGYRGDSCSFFCNDKCVTNSLGEKNCHMKHGWCLEGCVHGFRGRMCDKRCHSKCKDSLCFQNGLCAVGCERGWYGERCSFRCNDNCLLGSCDRRWGHCFQCVKGYHGLDCQKRCYDCVSGVCDQKDGVCHKNVTSGSGDVCVASAVSSSCSFTFSYVLICIVVVFWK